MKEDGNGQENRHKNAEAEEKFSRFFHSRQIWGEVASSRFYLQRGK
jgi:hypothetical protein